MSTVLDVESYAKVLPAPIKFSAVTTPDVTSTPADWMPILNPPAAVIVPAALILLGSKLLSAEK